jgi:PncC family amidohydrolase
LLTECSGASAYFAGGLVTYANRLKTSLLGVSLDTLEQYGAVSREVAEEMAHGARRTLGVEVALAVTGIAGPTGATSEKPLGLVHYAIATAEGVASREQVFPGSRAQVQRLAAFTGLHLVRQVLR